MKTISISFQSRTLNYHVQPLKEALEKGGEKGKEETTATLGLKRKENKSLSLSLQSKHFLQPSTNV